MDGITLDKDVQKHMSENAILEKAIDQRIRDARERVNTIEEKIKQGQATQQDLWDLKEAYEEYFRIGSDSDEKTRTWLWRLFGT